MIKLNKIQVVALICRSDTALLPVIRSLGIAGYRVYLIHSCPMPYAIKSRYVIGSFHVPNLEPVIIWYQHLQDLQKHHRVVGILPLDEHASLCLIRNPPPPGFTIPVTPLSKLETYKMAIHKGNLGRFLLQQHLPIPPTVFPSSDHDPVTQALDSIGLPIIAKATQLAFGQGLYFCQTESDLRRAVKNLQEKNVDHILQKVLMGSDLDFSFYAEDGEIIAYTFQRGILSGKPGYPPKKIRFENHPELLETMRRMVKALNWSGIAHVDTLLEDSTQQNHILEINGRFWGTILGSVAAGVNFPELMICRMKGIRDKPPSFKSIEYESGGIGPKWWMRHFFSNNNKVAKTAFPYFLKDPIPELSAWTNQFR